MSGRLVCDASALVALLLDDGPEGRWVAAGVAGADFAAPALVGLEVANIIRRHELASLVSRDQAAQALAELTGAALVTLDRRIARAPGVRCPVSVP